MPFPKIAICYRNYYLRVLPTWWPFSKFLVAQRLLHTTMKFSLYIIPRVTIQLGFTFRLQLASNQSHSQVLIPSSSIWLLAVCKNGFATVSDNKTVAREGMGTKLANNREYVGLHSCIHTHTHTHLQPGPHFQQPLLKGWHNPPIGCWPNIQQKVPIAADRGDKLPEEPRGVPEVLNPLSAIVAPRAVLDGEAALPFIRNEVTWSIPAGVKGQNM